MADEKYIVAQWLNMIENIFYRKSMWRQVRAQIIYTAICSSLNQFKLFHFWQFLFPNWHKLSDDDDESPNFWKVFFHSPFGCIKATFNSRHTRLTLNSRLKEVLICFSIRKQFKTRRKKLEMLIYCCFTKQLITKRGEMKKKSFQYVEKLL